MQTRTLGTNGPQVSALGPGLMGMSGRYGPADEAESIGSRLGYDARSAAVKTAAAYSLQRLNTDRRHDRYAEAQLASLDSERSTSAS